MLEKDLMHFLAPSKTQFKWQSWRYRVLLLWFKSVLFSFIQNAGIANTAGIQNLKFFVKLKFIKLKNHCQIQSFTVATITVGPRLNLKQRKQNVSSHLEGKKITQGRRCINRQNTLSSSKAKHMEPPLTHGNNITSNPSLWLKGCTPRCLESKGC